MELSLSTPALLFPAISLLLLAYTNRFLTLANLIRELHRNYHANPDERKIITAQLSNLRYRVNLIRSMQIYGVAAFAGSVVSMIALFTGQELVGRVIFGACLLLLLVSLALSLRELFVSVDALNFRLSDLENQ